MYRLTHVSYTRRDPYGSRHRPPEARRLPVIGARKLLPGETIEISDTAYARYEKMIALYVSVGTLHVLKLRDDVVPAPAAVVVPEAATPQVQAPPIVESAPPTVGAASTAPETAIAVHAAVSEEPAAITSAEPDKPKRRARAKG